MIRVLIKLAGPLRKYYKTSLSAKGEEVEVTEGTIVADLLADYHIPHEKAHLVVINRNTANLATEVMNGDEINVLPLAGGG